MIKYPKLFDKLPNPLRFVCAALWLAARFVCTLLLLVADAVLGFFVTIFVNPVNLRFAETVTLSYRHGEESVCRIISDKKELAVLIRLCRELAVECSSSRGFECGAVQLIFEGNGKKAVLQPARGTKDIMRFTAQDNIFFYRMGKANKRKLIALLEGYGVALS